MKSFPFDSDVTYDSDGNPEYDRGVDSTILSEFLHLMYKDGVFPNPSTGLQVTSSDNEMSVVVNPGNVMIQGRMGIEETYRTIVFEEAGTTYDRIDSVVARLNTNHDYRSIDLYVVKGTEASSPVAPDLARTGGIYELRLANVFIAKNTTKVSSERITDTRLNDEDCGIVTANPDTVDTTKIFNQYQASLDAYMQYVQECIDGTTAGNLQSQIDTLDVRTTDVENGLEELNSNLNSKANISTVTALQTSVNTINSKLVAGYVGKSATFKYTGAWASVDTGSFKLMHIISDGGTPAIMIPCNISTGTSASPYVVKNNSGTDIFQYFVSGTTLYVYVLNNGSTVGVSFIL